MVGVTRKRLDLSKSELLHMRDEGMSNAEIAKALDISMSTVYRYIGSAGFSKKKGIPHGSSKNLPPVEEPVSAPAKEVAPPRPPKRLLSTADVMAEMEGEIALYRTSQALRRVEVAVGEQTITIPYANLARFAMELQELCSELKV